MSNRWDMRIQRAFALFILGLWHGRAIYYRPEAWVWWEQVSTAGLLALAIWLLIDAREPRR